MALVEQAQEGVAIHRADGWMLLIFRMRWSVWKRSDSLCEIAKVGVT